VALSPFAAIAFFMRSLGSLYQSQVGIAAFVDTLAPFSHRWSAIIVALNYSRLVRKQPN